MIFHYRRYAIALLVLASNLACSDFCPEKIRNLVLYSREGTCTSFDDDALNVLVRGLYREDDICAPVQMIRRSTIENGCNVDIELTGIWEHDSNRAPDLLYGFARFEITNCPDACSEIIEFALGAGPMAFD